MIVNNYYIFVVLNRYMALTLLLLEQIMQSEVENIHARIDEHRTLIDKLFDRLDSIDRQLSLLWLAVEDLKVGEIVVVKPDERVAADGFVVKGITAINQAPVTGESMPVDKRPVLDDAAARADPDHAGRQPALISVLWARRRRFTGQRPCSAP